MSNEMGKLAREIIDNDDDGDLGGHSNFVMAQLLREIADSLEHLVEAVLILEGERS